MASGDSQDSTTSQTDLGLSEKEKQWLELLGDNEAREFMIQRLKGDDHVAVTSAPGAITSASEMITQTSSNRGDANSGMWPMMPMQFPFFTPYPPFWGTGPGQPPQQEFHLPRAP